MCTQMKHVCMSDRDVFLCQPDGRGRILIATDDKLLRRMFTAYLEDEGYLVLLAADGKQALEAAPGFGPDLIFLDMAMPEIAELDGLEVVRRLRANRNEREVRIVLLGGLGSDIAQSASLRAGADEYLTLPMPPRELVRCIQALLRHADASDADLGTGSRP